MTGVWWMRGSGEQLVETLDDAVQGNPWSRRLLLALITGVLWYRFAMQSDVERWRFPAMMLVALVAFELAIVFVKRGERDHALEGEELLAARRRGTLFAAGALAGVMLLAAFAFAAPWYGALAILFAYVGFLCSRYVPDALFDAPREFS